MCGIAGFLNHPSIFTPKIIIKDMISTLSHRGPDAEGVKIEGPVTFGHRRLSIQDLSPTGAQPMVSDSGRYYLTFNGEIYNFLKLKKILLNSGTTNFKGTSDTEILLKYIESYGLEKSLIDIRGMFAFSLWDRDKSNLYLIRDRMGQKPLYYYSHGGHFAFSSELKSLQKYPYLEKDISSKALQLYFKYNCIPSPYSIYKNVFKVEPGGIIKVDLNNQSVKVEKYWDLNQVSKKGLSNLIESDEQVLLTLEEKLLSVVEEQMISDVPFGAFLSGGIDSSLIVALMQRISKKPIDTFTIGFYESGFDEAIYAKRVAEHLGTNHHELYLDQKDCLEIIPNLSSVYSEPFSDSSQIPTFLVSKMAKKNVTVCLSGDGGDELFAGYNRHFWIDHIWKLKKNLTPVGTSLINAFVKSTSVSTLNYLGNYLFKGKVRSFGDSLLKANGALSQESPNEIYNSLVSHFDINYPLLLNRELTSDPFHINNLKLQTDSNKFLLQDQMTYLPNDILTKVDRASMANSLETRIPFLDKQIVELSWRIPFGTKCHKRKGKLPLRELLFKYVPKELLERPKAGFGIPLDTWLRKDLREWAEDLLSQKNINNSGLMDYEVVSKMWKEHLSGSHNWQYHLWDIIMLQSWYNRNF